MTTRSAAASASLLPASLRCEYRTDPLGVDAAHPRLSWILSARDASARGLRQTAYRVLAASSPERLRADDGDLWDSGRVSSDQALQIPYGGRPLSSFQQVFWKVRVWDQEGRESAWSPEAQWTAGILRESDWSGAHWIGGPAKDAAFAPESAGTVLLRREFPVRAGLRRAVVCVCGLGQYEMHINGARVGEDLLTPGWTNYRKTCLYDTYDVTALLKAGGQNAAGLFLGNGMYNVVPKRYHKFAGSFGPLKAIVLLRLEYGDGSVEWVGTDGHWRAAPGPITFSSVFGGEDYDARREPAGWQRPSFDDARWIAAEETTGPGGALRGLSCAAPPIRTFEVLKPVHVRTLRPGVAVYDLGQNASLMPRLAVRGPAGSVVRITPAELVHDDGSVSRSSVGGGEAFWQYTLKGERHGERYFPRFFYHGSRYLQVECLPAEGTAPGGALPEVTSLEGVVVQAASRPVGTFSCSSDLFNRIHTLVRWAQRSNMVSVMTDCPHRERLGWLEQDHLNGPSLRYEFDMAPLLTKAMNDMADSQLADGLVPDIAPEYVVFDGGFRDSPEWGSAFILVPWQQYAFDGDLDLLHRHYDGMKRYLDYLGSKAHGDIPDYGDYGLGDWYDLGPNHPGYSQLTPITLTATAFYYADADVLAKTADLLGKPEDAARFRALAARIAAAFNARFYDPATGQYATGSQCANSLPLALDMVPLAHRERVLDAVVKNVQSRGNALTAGDVGYRYLLRALADGGRSDVIYAMNHQSERPGYGYQLAQGATSLTEAWDTGRDSSQNHFMMGQIVEWFYHDLAGIQNAPGSAGFRHIVLRPAIVGDLTQVKASYESIRGLVACEWKRAGDRITLDVTLPPGTDGIVCVPTGDAATVREHGRTIAESPGVTYLRTESGAAVYSVGSGHYVFTATLPG